MRLCLSLILILSANTYANSFQDAYNSGLEAANNNKYSAFEKVKNFDNKFENKTIYDNYTNDPKEIGYLDKDIAQIARNNADTNSAAKAVNESANNRTIINTNENLIQKNIFIENNAGAIANGISNAYVDCNQKATDSDNPLIVCNGQTYCTHDNCELAIESQSALEHDNDFKKAIAAMSAANEAAMSAGNNYTEFTPSIFKGKSMRCRSYGFGVRDCCKDEGWGKKLLHCSEEENKLGKAKEDKKYIAPQKKEYCVKKVAGKCIKKKKAYCVYESKLAKIIQLGASQQLLGKNFGSGKRPNCKGLTPAQLQQLDFSKINFSEIYADIEDKTIERSQNEVTERIKEKVKKYYQDNDHNQDSYQ